MGGMASWWAGELLLLFPSVSPVTVQATGRVCKRKEEYTITKTKTETGTETESGIKTKAKSQRQRRVA